MKQYQVQELVSKPEYIEAVQFDGTLECMKFIAEWASFKQLGHYYQKEKQWQFVDENGFRGELYQGDWYIKKPPGTFTRFQKFTDTLLFRLYDKKETPLEQDFRYIITYELPSVCTPIIHSSYLSKIVPFVPDKIIKNVDGEVVSQYFSLRKLHKVILYKRFPAKKISMLRETWRFNIKVYRIHSQESGLCLLDPNPIEE